MEDPLDTMVTCPSCDALNVQSRLTCAECGAAFNSAAASDSARRRLVAARKLGKLRQDLRAVRLLYRVQALLTGVALVLFLIGGLDSIASSLEIAIGATLHAAAIAIALVAAHQIFKQPLLWSGMLAAIMSLGIVALRGRVGVLDILTTALAWMAFIAVIRAQSTIRAYPDIWNKSAGRAALAERREREGDEGARTRVARRYESSTLRVIAAVFIALVLVGVVRWWSNRASALDVPRASFEQAWLDEDVAGVASFFAVGSRDRMTSTLSRTLKKREWTGDIPPLASGDVEEGRDGKSARVVYATRDGSMSVTWAYDGAWRVTGIRFPDAR